MPVNKKSGSFSKIIRGFKEMLGISKSLFFVEMGSGIFDALYGYINIFFLAAIIRVLTGDRSVKALIILSAVMVGVNFIVYVARSFFGNKGEFLFGLFRFYEKSRIIEKLTRINFIYLEDADFEAVVRKHADNDKPCLAFADWMVYEIAGGMTKMALSFYALYPLVKTSLKGGSGDFIGSPYFFLIVFGAAVILSGVIVFLGIVLNKVFWKKDDDLLGINRIYGYYSDMISNYKSAKEIRIFNEKKLIEKEVSEKLLNEGGKIRKKAYFSIAMKSSYIAIIGALIAFGAYIFVGLKGLKGYIDIGSLFLYLSSFMLFFQGFSKLITSVGVYQEVAKSIGYYFNIMDYDAEKQPDGQLSVPDGVPFDIRINDLTFNYSGSKKSALERINLSITEGERIAIIGENGSGKTTFIKLLTGFYDDYEGEILLNGINLKEYKKDEYLKLFSVVFQDYKMFSYDITDNLSAEENPDEKRIEEVLSRIGMLERINGLPKGTRTYINKTINDDGVEISSGEAQKLALARALYKKAKLIILDEPTASLDANSEMDIYKRFDNLLENRTAIYISHRLSSAKLCNKIIVFDKGRIVQTGAHEELIKDKNGKYFELWNAQAQYYL